MDKAKERTSGTSNVKCSLGKEKATHTKELPSVLGLARWEENSGSREQGAKSTEEDELISSWIRA